MISTTQSYGKFIVQGYGNKLEVTIIRNTEDIDPCEYVKAAIKFAKHFKCDICRQVEYDTEKGITFEVSCNSRTSYYIYDYGSAANTCSNPSVSNKDLEDYSKKFGSIECIHPGFKKRYWYVKVKGEELI